MRLGHVGMKERYECDNDVVQDYYVYLHKDKPSGVPFYVGKGRGKRAWSHYRNDLWREKVKDLKGAYDVEIVEDKLTEREAHDLEITLILKYKRIWEGGTLVNKTPGHGMAVAVGFPIEMEEAHKKSSPYRRVTNEQKHGLAQEILDKMTGFRLA